MQGKALLIVRAVVPDPADRPAFDRWYEQVHLPEAVVAFNAEAGWRGWSPEDPQVHYACYRFASWQHLLAMDGTEGQRRMAEEFDRHWTGRATRSRDRIRVDGFVAG